MLVLVLSLNCDPRTQKCWCQYLKYVTSLFFAGLTTASQDISLESEKSTIQSKQRAFTMQRKRADVAAEKGEKLITPGLQC